MPRSKKPKKAYRQKGVIRDPVSFVIKGIKPADPDAQLRAKLNLHGAMVNLTQGRGTKIDWQEVANALNVGLALAEMGYGKEFVPDLVKAQGAMALLRDRGKATGRFVFKAEEMSAVNTGIDLHDQQIELAPIADFERAIRAVELALAKGNFVTVERIDEQPQPSSPQIQAA